MLYFNYFTNPCQPDKGRISAVIQQPKTVWHLVKEQKVDLTMPILCLINGVPVMRENWNDLLNNNEIVKSAGDMKINTIHLKILKNNKGMFNLGKINTIIEEEEEIKKRHRINSRSVNKMKDLRFIYKPYIPQILSDQKTLKNNLSEKSIFGNLNYSFNQNLIKKPDTKSSSDIVMLKLKKRKLIPIVKFKRKGE